MHRVSGEAEKNTKAESEEQDIKTRRALFSAGLMAAASGLITACGGSSFTGSSSLSDNQFTFSSLLKKFK